MSADPHYDQMIKVFAFAGAAVAVIMVILTLTDWAVVAREVYRLMH